MSSLLTRPTTGSVLLAARGRCADARRCSAGVGVDRPAVDHPGRVVLEIARHVDAAGAGAGRARRPRVRPVVRGRAETARDVEAALRRVEPERVSGRQLGAVRQVGQDRAASRGSRSTSRSPVADLAGLRAPSRPRSTVTTTSFGWRPRPRDVRPVRARGDRALRRPLHAAELRRPAAGRPLLVVLERAELRPGSRPASDRRIDQADRAGAVSVAVGLRLRGAAPDPARRAQHGADRRTGRHRLRAARTRPPWPLAGRHRTDPGARVPARPVLRQRPLQAAAGLDRDPIRVPGDARRGTRVPLTKPGAVRCDRIRRPSVLVAPGAQREPRQDQP